MQEVNQIPSSEIESWAKRIQAGERRALARAITLVESERLTDAEKSESLLAALSSLKGPTRNAVRVGISGTPGVGKSTLIEALGQQLIAEGHRVAVLAVDPTSPIAGGSILGDKTRMTQLANSLAAYVRPSPARGLLGGLGWATPEAILLCEVAGYDVVLVESVGVGQSELSTAYATDVFVLLMQPFAGDDVQAMKRGVLELSDIVVVNKADGDTAHAAERALADLRRVFQGKSNPRLLKTSASTQQGVAQLWSEISTISASRTAAQLTQLRQVRRQKLWAQTAPACLWRQLQNDPERQRIFQQVEKTVVQGEYQPLTAARQLYRYLFVDAQANATSA